MENKDTDFNKNVKKLQEGASNLIGEVKKESETENGKKNLQIAAVLGITVCTMALVFIMFSGPYTGHSKEEIKQKAYQYTKEAREALIKKKQEEAIEAAKKTEAEANANAESEAQAEAEKQAEQK